MVYTYEADTLIFKLLYQRVMSLNGLSFASARPAILSVLMVQEIQYGKWFEPRSCLV